MENKNCDVLFEYLRSILYDPAIRKPDLCELDEPFLKLGRGLEFLQHAVEEMLTYSEDLSRGNLSGPIPEKDNFLCVNLKNIHANLNHLTWQAEQVASGDYSQHVSYLGDFSKAFNLMTEQLKEREEELKRKAETYQKRTEVMEGYNELLMKMTMKRAEWVFVVDTDSRKVVYCNKVEHEDPKCHCCRKFECRDYGRARILEWTGDAQEVWEFEAENGRYLRINSYPIEWHERNSFVHVVADITEALRKEQRLSDKAYMDPLTGVRSRVFFEEAMERILREKQTVTLCYLDIDGLKYVNDHYGHLEGDNYIREFVAAIQKSFRSDDVLARTGGDEFCLLLSGKLKELAHDKLEAVRAEFMERNQNEYPVSFSYGIYEIDETTHDLTLKDILRQVDVRMYRYKRKYKEKRE